MNLIRIQKRNGAEVPRFDRLLNLREEIDRLFNSPFGLDEPEFFGWTPALDVYQDKDNFIVRAELPGMTKEDIEITLHENTLILSGERRSNGSHEGSEVSRSERYFGRFHRSFQLPKPVHAEKVQAAYKDGVLTVTLPKTEESKPKQIEVKVS
jgi:HSP20 family protein